MFSVPMPDFWIWIVSMSLKLLSSLPPLVRPWFTFWPFPLRFRSPVSLRALCVCLFGTIPFPLLHGSWGQSQGAVGSALWSCQGSLDKAPCRWAWYITHSECVGQVPAISTAPWLLLPPQREYTRDLERRDSGDYPD